MCDSTEKLLSTKQAADYLSVSESSIKRWVDRGVIRAHKTSGGHRKIAYNDLFEFIQENDPEKFGKKIKAAQSIVIADLVQEYKSAMQAGNIFKMVDLLQSNFLVLNGLPGAIDKLIYPAYLSLRADCVHPSEECLVLHRALDQTRKVLTYAKSKLVLPTEQKRSKKCLLVDIGYEVDVLPTYLAEYTLASDIQSIQLGFDVPIAVLKGALEREQPDYLWVSAGGSRPPGFLKRLNIIREFTDGNKVTCFYLGPLLEEKLPVGHRVESFQDFAQQLA